ncbi:glycosyltransferase family 2 protein [Parabacteroides sp.]
MKVSVITVTWNSAATLRDTLESVLAQTYPDIEHIVVDGGSTDGTMELIRAYEALYVGRLRYISEPDRGIYDAMNKGIGMASGEVVGILNSDDFYTSNDTVERLVDELVGCGVDAVYGDVHFVDDKDLTKCVRYYSSESFRRWKMRFGFMPAHPSFYCRKEVYERFGLFSTSYKVAADFENLLRLIYVGKISIQYVPKDCVTMRTGGASTSGLASHRQILADHVRAYRENQVRSNALLDSLRYIYKVIEIAKFKLK